MNALRSPIGALGVLMALIEAVAGCMLFAVKEQPDLQRWIVFGILGYMFLIVAMVWWLLWYILVKRKQPAWLFDPASLHPAAQLALVLDQDVLPPEVTDLLVDSPEDVDQ